jgi:hypothetical protein
VVTRELRICFGERRGVGNGCATGLRYRLMGARVTSINHGRESQIPSPGGLRRYYGQSISGDLMCKVRSESGAGLQV